MLTDEQRKKLLDMLFDAGVVGAPRRNPIAFYVQTLLAQARAEEREASAKACEHEAGLWSIKNAARVCRQCAATIRARKDAT